MFDSDRDGLGQGQENDKLQTNFAYVRNKFNRIGVPCVLGVPGVPGLPGVLGVCLVCAWCVWCARRRRGEGGGERERGKEKGRRDI